jgi:hypothetical protein
MDGRRLSELTRVPDAVPRVRRQPRPLPRSWALAVGAGWPLLLIAMTALAPEPADPNAVPTFVDSALFVAVTYSEKFPWEYSAPSTTPVVRDWPPCATP